MIQKQREEQFNQQKQSGITEKSENRPGGGKSCRAAEILDIYSGYGIYRLRFSESDCKSSSPESFLSVVVFTQAPLLTTGRPEEGGCPERMTQKRLVNQIMKFATHHLPVATPRKPAFELASAAAGLKWPRVDWIVGIVCLFLVAISAQANTWYVDNTATGANNGTSWANAWTSLGAITGVIAGDTVYISGGSTSQTYTGVSNWSPVGGAPGKPVTYSTGQEAGHNGTVIFNGAGGTFLSTPVKWVALNGNFGGNRHMTIQNYGSAILVTGPANGGPDGGIFFSYCNILAPCDMLYNPVPYGFDHNAFAPPQGSDHCIHFGGDASPTGFDSNLIHDNTFTVFRDSGGSGAGDDCIRWGNSVSIYNNYFKGVGTTYTGSQHQDGVQIAGPFVKVYNNTFESLANSAVYIDYFGNTDSIRIYNNVMFIGDPVLNSYPRGVDFALDGGGSGFTVSNSWVANNVCVDYPNFFGIKFGGVTGANITYTNCYVLNNLCYNSGFTCDTGPTQSKNITPSTGGSTGFVSYSVYNTNNNFHLTSSFTAAIGTGTSLPSTIFNTDKDGNAWSAGGWCIGAYAYGGSHPASPQGLRITASQ